MDTTVKYMTNNLVEYESVMDTDLATATVFLLHVKKANIYKPSITSGIKENKLKNLLLFRTDRNPLSCIINDKYKDSYDTLLAEIKDKYDNEIRELTVPNGIFELVLNLTMAKDVIKTDILCKNKDDADRIVIFTNRLKTICTKPKNVDGYTCIFVKYIDLIEPYLPFEGKYVYIVNAQYNLGKEFIPKPMSVLIGESNIIRMVDAYRDLTVPNANLEVLLKNGKRSKNDKK